MTARFAPGAATAYVFADVMAIDGRPAVDAGFASRCATATDVAGLVDVTAWQDGAIAIVDGRSVGIAVIGAADVRVATPGGVHRVEGGDAWTHHRFDDAEEVTMAVRVGADATSVAPGDLTHRVDGGVVPAAVVARRLAPVADAPVDPLDALFGHTVDRTVEDAAVRPVETRAALPVGVLVFSTGERVLVDRSMVLGRNPVSSPDAPTPTRLVKIASPGVSRRHAAIEVDRWNATIDDLGSSNGTRVTIPGELPRSLVAGVPADLVIGAVVDLGGDVSFAVEEVA